MGVLMRSHFTEMGSSFTDKDLNALCNKKNDDLWGDYRRLK
jgi:hypothetical protein